MTEITLKGGHTTADRRLDRLPQFDERSRSFPIRTLVGTDTPLRSMTWQCPAHLDQGNEGACVGFSWAHELNAYPAHVVADATFAREKIYKAAQKIDDWPGEDYDGTSVLAGAKTVKALGYMDEYRWAFGMEDAIRAIAFNGPVVVGIVWLQSMFKPRPSGLLEVDRGAVAGGHAILVRGLILKPRLKGESSKVGPIVRLRNSWGPGWGAGGDCFLKLDDFDWILREQGECCVPVARNRSPRQDIRAMEETHAD